MILADIHTHTSFSTDSDEPMESMIKAAISRGLKYLCFTEHMDKDYPTRDPGAAPEFFLDTDRKSCAFEGGFRRIGNKLIQHLRYQAHCRRQEWKTTYIDFADTLVESVMPVVLFI